MLFTITMSLLGILLYFVYWDGLFNWGSLCFFISAGPLYVFSRLALSPLFVSLRRWRIKKLHVIFVKQQKSLEGKMYAYKKEYGLSNAVAKGVRKVLRFVARTVIVDYVSDEIMDDFGDDIGGFLGDGEIGNFADSILRMQAEQKIQFQLNKLANEFCNGFFDAFMGIFKSEHQLKLEADIRLTAARLSRTVGAITRHANGLKNESGNAMMSSFVVFVFAWSSAAWIGSVFYNSECSWKQKICRDGSMVRCNRQGEFKLTKRCASGTCQDRSVCAPVPIDGISEKGAFANCLEAKDDGVYWVRFAGHKAHKVFCDNTTGGGGWHLAAVVSDDGQDTWTWSKRYLLNDSQTLGTLDRQEHDLKTVVFGGFKFKDVLFVHSPSGTWASYHNVDRGERSLGKFLRDGSASCLDLEDGYVMTEGTLEETNSLCSTRLYIHPNDHDGHKKRCRSNHDAYGFAWSASLVNRCPFDDPGLSGGIGPEPEMTPSNEDKPISLLRPAQKRQYVRQFDGLKVDRFHPLGFGFAAGLNTGKPLSAENNLKIYVR